MVLVPVILPGLEVATYVASPVLPSYVGWVKLTVADAFPALALTEVGGFGFFPPELLFPITGIKHSDRQVQSKYSRLV